MSYGFRLDGVIYPVRFSKSPLDRNCLEVYAMADADYRIAALTWHQFTGEITYVTVQNSFRRRGIATALLVLARKLYPEPPIVHSSCKTLAGELWAASVP